MSVCICAIDSIGYFMKSLHIKEKKRWRNVPLEEFNRHSYYSISKFKSSKHTTYIGYSCVNVHIDSVNSCVLLLCILFSSIEHFYWKNTLLPSYVRVKYYSTLTLMHIASNFLWLLCTIWFLALVFFFACYVVNVWIFILSLTKMIAFSGFNLLFLFD